MTRAAAAAGVAGARDFGHGCETTRGDLVFDRVFGNKETGAYESFVADPLVTRSIAVLANRCEQRVAREFRTVLSSWLQPVQTQLNYGSFGGSFTYDLFSQ